MLVPVPYVAVYAWLEVSCDTVEVQPSFFGGSCSRLDGVFRLVSGNAFHVVEYLMFALRGITGCPGNVCIFSPRLPDERGLRAGVFYEGWSRFRLSFVQQAPTARVM